MSIADALSRISQIQQQLDQLQTGQLPAPPAAATGSTGAAGAAGPTSFNDALAQATGAFGAPGAPGGAGAPGAPGATGGWGSPGAGAGTTLGAEGTGAGSGVALAPAAAARLTSGQQQFASRLAAQTGLNPGVISAWLLAEESGGAAQSRQAANNNDWLNIGYTDSGTFGSGDSVWSDPVAAADATAGWLKGQDTIPGYGTASSGIQSILSTVGQSPAAQIAALQGSGWASGGYPELATLYGQISG